MTILVTGGAGFIGYHLIKRLLNNAQEDVQILSVDSINSYYDVALKRNRLKLLNIINKHKKN